MLIIPGIIASSYPRVSNSYESIATVTVGAGGSSSISFTSIPSTYKHLQIRYLIRSARATVGDDLAIQVNSDTGNNYAWHLLYGDGGTAGAGAASSTNKGVLPTAPAASGTANAFGVGVIDLLDYANTSKYKTIRALGGDDRNGAGTFEMTSGLWQSTTAISGITLLSFNGANLAPKLEAVPPAV